MHKKLIVCCDCRGCSNAEHKAETNKKLCDCEVNPQLWMNCKICADHNPRAGTIYCKTCNNLKQSPGHKLCPDYVPKEQRYRVMQRVVDKKPANSRASKPTLAELLLKERGILKPLAFKPVGPLPGSSVASIPPNAGVVIGGNGVFAPRAALPQHAMIAAFEAGAATGKRKSLEYTSPEAV